MPRSLTAALQAATYAQHTGVTPILLLTVEHESFEIPVRLCRNNVDLISRGHRYTAWPFDLPLPDDVEERPPEARVEIDNISRLIVHLVRDVPSGDPPTAVIELVLAEQPDDVEEAWGPFKLPSVTWNVQTVSALLKADDRSQEPFPAKRYTADMFPALHGLAELEAASA